MAADEEVGRALRTQAGTKPVFVSVGHRTSLENACAHTLALAPKYRQPETTRRADALCRRALREVVRGREHRAEQAATDHTRS